jgi:hypothetical protein
MFLVKKQISCLADERRDMRQNKTTSILRKTIKNRRITDECMTDYGAIVKLSWLWLSRWSSLVVFFDIYILRCDWIILAETPVLLIFTSKLRIYFWHVRTCRIWVITQWYLNVRPHSILLLLRDVKATSNATTVGFYFRSDHCLICYWYIDIIGCYVTGT